MTEILWGFESASTSWETWKGFLKENRSVERSEIELERRSMETMKGIWKVKTSMARALEFESAWM